MLRARQTLSYFLLFLFCWVISNKLSLVAGDGPVIRNPDGTYTRLFSIPSTPAEPDPATSSSPVLSKDVPIKPNNETWFRIHLPRQALDSSTSTKKFPLIVYFHGGGFVLFDAAGNVIHNFCTKMALHLNAIVVNVAYRLAPEHRLPAAYDDALEALQSIKNSQEVWLREHVDFSRTFMYGISAGANIVYNAALRVSKNVGDIEPLKINGLILHHPFFGGIERTNSEKTLGITDKLLPLSVTDSLWSFSLPEGADRDHEYCNPMAKGEYSNQIQQFHKLNWKVLIAYANLDPLIDRQKMFMKMLEENDVRTVTYESDGTHGIEESVSAKADAFFDIVKNFVSSC